MPRPRLDDLGARARTRGERDISATKVDLSDPDPAAETAVRALMTPLSPERAGAVLDRVLAASVSATAPAALPFARPRLSGLPSMLVVGSLVLAAAAAVLLSILPSTQVSPGPAAVVASNTVTYEISLLHASGTSRGDDVQLATFAAGDPVVLRLRPRDPVRTRMAASVRAVQDGRALPLPWLPRQVGDDGVLEIRGAADDLLGAAPGVWVLEVSLRRDGANELPLWEGRTSLRVVGAASPRE